MNPKTKKILKSVFIILIMVAFLSVNIVFAATKSKINFCDYAGARRTLKIIGMLINIAKIVVPLIIILTQMVSMTKIVVSGKDDDIKESFKILVKKIIAGLIIFFIPGIIDYTIDNLAGFNNADSGFAQCSNCLLDTNHCSIPTTDPDYYDED